MTNQKKKPVLKKQENYSDLIVVTSPIPEIQASTVVTSKSTDKIFSALSKAQGQVEKAKRSKSASDNETHETWQYAALDDVLEAVKDARAKNGLAVVERFPAGKACLHAILIHKSGQWIDYGTYAFGDYETQNEKSEIITRARRHFMKCMFGVVDQADDVDESMANRRPITGEDIDAETPEDNGATGKTLNDAKEAWRIEAIIKPDGSKDFHQFVADYEVLLVKVSNMNELSLLSRANSKTLLELEEQEPALFQQIQDATAPVTQNLL